ncbi:MAG TPA: PilZ domain-containing protein [Sphingobium sp.]|nr:PilZ domain-containing protein [Sphingobium sp.]
MTDQCGSMTASVTQRRHAARRKMFEPVTLGFGGSELRAHFLDLSCSGALAHCETPPPSGSYVSVGALGLETSGRVMWAKGKRFGIQFSQPLSQAETDALIAGG